MFTLGMHQKVMIIKGVYKGELGIVVARVENAIWPIYVQFDKTSPFAMESYLAPDSTDVSPFKENELVAVN